MALTVTGLLAARSQQPVATVEQRLESRLTAVTVVANDPWFGEDKLKHLGLSFAATSFASATARSLGIRDVAPPLAAGLAFAAGVGKELRDAHDGRPFSWIDLAWDAVGVGAAYVLARNGH